MSHSISIPVFVTERKEEILNLSKFKRKATQNGTRGRIAMYRTRSYVRYSMSRAVRQRNKRGPFLMNKSSKENKTLYRRHKRSPSVLQSTFAPAVSARTGSLPIKSSQPAKKKRKCSDSIVSTGDKDVADANEGTEKNQAGRLNTHIWHTKRFHIEKQSGWYVPTKHKSRGLKAVDGLADSCAVQDVSYAMAHQLQKEQNLHGFRTLQLTGSVADINSLFNQFLDPLLQVVDVGADGLSPTIAVEREVSFFTKGKFPSACIGPVTLMVIPGSAGDARGPGTVKVLVSCHPAIATSVHQQLLSVLSGPNPQSSPSDEMSVDSTGSAQESLCSLQLVPAQWNRISLRGRGATRALLAILHCPSALTSDALCAGSTRDTDEDQNVAKIEFLRAILSVRNVSNLWEEGTAVAVNVADPRLNATKIVSANTSTLDAAGSADKKEQQRKVSAQLRRRPADFASTPLFQDNAAFKFKPEHELNAEKHTEKVKQWEGLFQTAKPFAPFSPTATTATAITAPSTAAKRGAVNSVPYNVPAHMCPLWIVRRNSSARSHKTQKQRMEGFDITLPAAWSSLIFQTLQLRGTASAVGSEEMAHLCAKAGVPSFPRDYPDTPAGRAYWQAYHNKLRNANAKRPPRKQIGHNNLASLLLAASTSTSNSVVAVDDSSSCDINSDHFQDVLIVRGENYLKDFRPPPYEDLHEATIVETRQEIAAQTHADSTYCWTSPYIPQLPALPPLMFLQVLLVPMSKGLVLDLAEVICPTDADIEQFCSYRLNTQARRKAPHHDKAAEEDHLSAAHSGFYKRSTANVTVPTTHVNKKQPVQDLPQSWLGVRLSKRVKTPSAVSTSDSPADCDGNVTPAPEVGINDHSNAKKKPPHKHKAVPTMSADYDVGVLEGRRIIGTVTTGQKEHLNNTHFAVGLCNVNALHDLFRRSYGRYLHPQAHILVLFRNARSDWLRYAILQIV